MGAKKNESPLIYVPAGVVLLSFFGLIYAWSVFAGVFEMEFGWSRSQTSLTFSICMSLFCIGGIVSGLLNRKISSRKILFLSAGFILIGLYGVSKIKGISGLYFNYGALCGFGVGLGYNSSINSILKMFPERKGLISGILLMAFGSGGMVWGAAIPHLLSAYGWRSSFCALGIIFFFVIAGYAVFVPRLSHEEAAEIVQQGEARSFTAQEMIKTKSFRYFMIWTVLLSAAGLTIVGHAALYSKDLGASDPFLSIAVGTISLANGLGRIASGWLFDKIGVKKSLYGLCIIFNLSVYLLIISSVTVSLAVMIIAYVFAGLSYGGVSTAKSVFAYTYYGTRYYGINFSVLNLNLIFSSYLGPFAAGALKSGTSSYMPSFILMAFMGGASLLILYALMKESSSVI